MEYFAIEMIRKLLILRSRWGRGMSVLNGEYLLPILLRGVLPADQDSAPGLGLVHHGPGDPPLCRASPRDASAANTYAPASAPKPFQKRVHCMSPPISFGRWLAAS